MALNFLNDGYFAGKVGIGTESPSDKLDVQGAGGVGIRVSNSTNPGYYANLKLNYNDVSTMQLTCLGTSILQAGNTGNTVLASRTNKDIILSPNGTGNVGIGIDTPQAPLSFENVAGNKIDFYYDTSSNDRYGIQVQPSELRIHSGAVGQSTGGITFGKDDGTTFTEAMRVGNDGNVGIGTAPNQYSGYTTLTLGRAAGNGSLLDFEYQNTRTFSVYANVNGGNINVITAKPLIFLTSGAEKMRITSTGGISFGSTGTAYGGVGQILKSNGNASPTWIDGSAIPGVPAGSGTLYKVAMWTPDGDTLGNAPITISGNNSTFTGTVTAATYYKSSGTSAVLGTNAAGEVLLRPTSSISSTAQSSFTTTLATIGTDATFTGSVTVNASAARILTINRGTASGGYMAFQNNGVDKFYIGSRGVVSGSGGTGYDFYAVGGNDLRFFSGTLLTLTLDTSANATFAGNVIVDSALLSNQENTDVDTGTETVASVAIATYTAAFFDFVIKKTTNVRSGTVYACHDGTTVQFTETSTQDLGDTSDVTLSVDISGGNMRLRATTTSDNWSVKSLIRAI